MSIAQSAASAAEGSSAQYASLLRPTCRDSYGSTPNTAWLLVLPLSGRHRCCYRSRGGRGRDDAATRRGGAGAGAEAVAAGAKAAAATAIAGAEAGTDRSQRRADPHPRDAARARSGQQDRQLHGVARPRFAGFPDQHGGTARRNFCPTTARQRRPVRGRGDRAATHAATADRSQRHDAHGGLLSVSAHAGEFRVALRAGGRTLASVRAWGLIWPGGTSRAATACSRRAAGGSAFAQG